MKILRVILENNIPKNYFSSRAQYSILAESEEHRKEIISALDSKKIPSMIYYKKSLHLLGTFKYLGYEKGDFQSAEKDIKTNFFIADASPYLTKKDQDYVIGVVNG